MRVLIVSFDRTLTDNLKDTLSDHEVFTAKNSEEAIKMIPSDMDVIIYDAISGAISEEDINTLYTKKFSNSKYLILYDELFPVDPNNVIAPKKILVSRDEDPKVIKEKMMEEPTEEVREEAVGVAEPPQPQETPEEAPVQEEQPVKEEVSVEAPPPEGGKVLVVSFDQTLIDTIKGAIGSDLEVTSVKTVRQAIDQGKDASVVIFDAISGIIAEKGLVDMSKDDTMSKKPYVILVDDLFPINVDAVPIEKKFPISRDAEPSQLKNVVFQALTQAVAVEEPVQRVEEVEETVQEEVAPEEAKAEEVPAGEVSQEEPVAQETLEEEKVEEIVEREIPEEVPEIEIEPVEPQEEAPAMQALEKIMEEKETFREEEKPREVEAVELPENIENIIREAVSSSLSEERIREVVSRVIQERMEDLKDLVSEAVRAKIDQVLEEMDLKEVIRQTAYQALKDRLDELVT